MHTFTFRSLCVHHVQKIVQHFSCHQFHFLLLLRYLFSLLYQPPPLLIFLLCSAPTSCYFDSLCHIFCKKKSISYKKKIKYHLFVTPKYYLSKMNKFYRNFAQKPLQSKMCYLSVHFRRKDQLMWNWQFLHGCILFWIESNWIELQLFLSANSRDRISLACCWWVNGENRYLLAIASFTHNSHTHFVVMNFVKEPTPKKKYRRLDA